MAGITTPNLPSSPNPVELLGNDYVGTQRRTVRTTIDDLRVLLGTGGGGGGGTPGDVSELIEAIQGLTQIATADRDRPGDARALYSQEIEGAGADRAPIALGTIVTGDRGAMLRIPSASSPIVIATRQDMAVEAGSVYAARWGVQRYKNTSDPLGDNVECRIAWLDKNKILINSTIADAKALTVADGARYIVRTFSLDQAADLTAPAGTVYATIYLRILGGDGITDVEIIDGYRTTGLPGPIGSDGRPPSYEINNDTTMIRWSQPDGTVGPWLDLGVAARRAEVARDEAVASEGRAQNLVDAAQAAYVGFQPGTFYDLGRVTDEIQLFSSDLGSVTDAA